MKGNGSFKQTDSRSDDEWHVCDYIEAVEDLLMDWMWSESRTRVNSVFVCWVGFYVQPEEWSCPLLKLKKRCK